MNDPRNTEGLRNSMGAWFVLFFLIFIRIATSQAGLLMSGGVGPRKIALQAIATAGCFYFFPLADYPAFLNSSALLSGETLLRGRNYLIIL